MDLRLFIIPSLEEALDDVVKTYTLVKLREFNVEPDSNLDWNLVIKAS